MCTEQVNLIIWCEKSKVFKYTNGNTNTNSINLKFTNTHQFDLFPVCFRELYFFFFSFSLFFFFASVFAYKHCFFWTLYFCFKLHSVFSSLLLLIAVAGAVVIVAVVLVSAAASAVKMLASVKSEHKFICKFELTFGA